MIRKIIEIDENKCNGCGLCVTACHEGAISLVNSKARLMREDFCDGLGDCLPTCPTGAISFTEREAPAFDAEAVQRSKQAGRQESLPCGCPGTHARALEKKPETVTESAALQESELRQWPVQIKLVPINAPYFDGADLLIAADCTAYAYGNFHGEFMRNKITLIGCPKLDEGDYSEKLTAILEANKIKSVTVVRMEVPCCAGIANAAARAVSACGKAVPLSIITVGTGGKIIS